MPKELSRDSADSLRILSASDEIVKSNLGKALKRALARPLALGLLGLLALVIAVIAAAIWGQPQYQVTAVFTATPVTQVPFGPEGWKELALGELRSTWFSPSHASDSGEGGPDAPMNQHVNFSTQDFPLVAVTVTGNAPEIPDQAIRRFRDGNLGKQPLSAREIAERSKSISTEIQMLKTRKKDYLHSNGSKDIGQELMKKRDDLNALEYRLRLAQSEEKSAQSELAKLHQKLAEQRMILESQMEKDPQVANKQTLQDLSLRQKIIKDMIDEEKYTIELRAQLDEKNMKKQRLQRLLPSGKVDQADLDMVIAEIQTIQKKLDGSPKLKELKNEWANLNKTIVPISPSPKSQPAFGLTKTLEEKFLEKNNELSSLSNAQQHLETEIQRNRAEFSLLTRVLEESNKVDDAIEEWETQLKSLSQTSSGTPSIPGGHFAFEVQSQSEVQSTWGSRGTIFPTVAVSSIGLGFLLLWGIECLRGARLARDIAASLRIPALWVSSRHQGAGEYRQLRRLCQAQTDRSPLALQIQAIDSRDASLAAITTVANGLAGAFAQRGEKVLLVDLGTPSGQNEGFSDFHQTNSDTWPSLTQPGTHPNIIRMGPGKAHLSQDSLTRNQLNRFLETVSTQQTVVIFCGTNLSQNQQVEALGKTMETVLVSAGNPTLESESVESLLDLIALDQRPKVLVLV